MSICLAMIVKNESAVLERCLRSVLAAVNLDSCVICDTGSTDNTRAIAYHVLADIPGDIIDRPWKNFAHNRNEALELAEARADYVIVIDADDTLEAKPGYILPELTLSAYAVRHVLGATEYHRTTLIRSADHLRYEGVVHEVLPPASGSLDGLTVRCLGGGARSKDPEHFLRDAELLEKSLKDQPGNTRTAFYLAQSYHCAGKYKEARAAYKRRIAMGGWEEEVWQSLLQIGQIGILEGQSFTHLERAFLAAYEKNPGRAEPLVSLAEQARFANRHALAVMYARQASSLPKPENALFVRAGDYEWRARDELAISLYWLGQHEEARELNKELLRSAPEDQHPRLKTNLGFCEKALPSPPQSEKWHVAVPHPEGYVHDVFRELAESLQEGLAALGRNCTLSCDYDPARQNLVLGASLISSANLALPPPGSILYQLEQVSSESTWFSEDYLAMLRQYRVWDYDEDNARALRALGVEVESVVPVGCSMKMRLNRSVPRDIDVVFVGSLNERRVRILEQLRIERGLRVEHLFGVYGAERDRVVERAKVALNVHYYESSIFEVVRVSDLIANGVPVVSETSRGQGGFDFEGVVIFAKYSDLAAECERVVRNEVLQENLATLGRAVADTRSVEKFLCATRA